MTVTELALQAGISKAYLSQVETGKVARPSAVALYRIASALGTSVGALLGAVSEPSIAEIDIPPELEEFARESNLAEDDKLMLARIRHRGRRPKTANDWRYLFESIRRITGGGP
jgi:transcriptional regulator with XRE-family HTH domain